MSNYRNHADQLREVYREYAKTIETLTAQDFFRGQSVIEGLLLEMSEIEQMIKSIEEFDKKYYALKEQAQKNYEYFLSRAKDFE